MTLDKALYRSAHQAYRQWHEAEAAVRGRAAGQLSSVEAWRRYVAVVELCWRLCPHPSQHQRQDKLMALDRYYATLKRLEERRQAHGTPA